MWANLSKKPTIQNYQNPFSTQNIRTIESTQPTRSHTMHIILCTHIVVEWMKTYAHAPWLGKTYASVTFSRFYFFGRVKCVCRVLLLFLFSREFTLASLGSHSVCNPFMRHLEPISYHARNSEKKKKKINLFDVSFTLQSDDACVCTHRVCVCVSKSVISETKYEIEWCGKFDAIRVIYMCVYCWLVSGEIISQSKLADSIWCALINMIGWCL